MKNVKSGPYSPRRQYRWRWSIPSPTDQVWWKSMHAISSYRGNICRQRPCTRPPAWPPQTGPITIHCAAMLTCSV